MHCGVLSAIVMVLNHRKVCVFGLTWISRIPSGSIESEPLGVGSMHWHFKVLFRGVQPGTKTIALEREESGPSRNNSAH